jgi:hypothetical protein
MVQNHLADRTITTPTGVVQGADGRGYMYVTYTAAGVKNTPMKIKPGATGWCATALADDTNYFYVGVPTDAITIATVNKIQVTGRVAAMITGSLTATAGNGLNITDGAVANPSAYTVTSWTGAAAAREFATVLTSKATASTTVDCWLLGHRIQGS